MSQIWVANKLWIWHLPKMAKVVAKVLTSKFEYIIRSNSWRCSKSLSLFLRTLCNWRRCRWWSHVAADCSEGTAAHHWFGEPDYRLGQQTNLPLPSWTDSLCCCLLRKTLVFENKRNAPGQLLIGNQLLHYGKPPASTSLCYVENDKRRALSKEHPLILTKTGRTTP